MNYSPNSWSTDQIFIAWCSEEEFNVTFSYKAASDVINNEDKRADHDVTKTDHSTERHVMYTDLQANGHFVVKGKPLLNRLAQRYLNPRLADVQLYHVGNVKQNL